MDDIKKTCGSSYRNMMAQVKESFDNYEAMFPALKGKKLKLAGFVWFQGPNLPFVIAAMGQNGSKPAAGAMAEPLEK